MMGNSQDFNIQYAPGTKTIIDTMKHCGLDLIIERRGSEYQWILSRYGLRLAFGDLDRDENGGIMDITLVHKIASIACSMYPAAKAGVEEMIKEVGSEKITKKEPLPEPSVDQFWKTIFLTMLDKYDFGNGVPLEMVADALLDKTDLIYNAVKEKKGL